MQVQTLPIFWLICILWAIYYWYWNTSTTQSSDSNTAKVVSDLNSDRRQSTSSIDSVDYSDNEGTRRKNIQKIKYEIRTRWPSRTFLSTRDCDKPV